jgi:hypothetical protein
MQSGVRERAIVAVRRFHERIDDPRVALLLGECEAQRDDSLGAHLRRVFSRRRVPEQRPRRLFVFQKSEDLDRGNHRAGGFLCLLVL